MVAATSKLFKAPDVGCQVITNPSVMEALGTGTGTHENTGHTFESKVHTYHDSPLKDQVTNSLKSEKGFI